MKTSKLLLIIPAALIIALPVSAQEVSTACEEAPAWFFMLEIIGTVFAMGTVAISYYLSTKTEEVLRKILRMHVLGIAFFAVALLFRSFTEFVGLSGFEYEFGFELLLYVGLLVIFIGSFNGIQEVYLSKK